MLPLIVLIIVVFIVFASIITVSGSALLFTKNQATSKRAKVQTGYSRTGHQDHTIPLPHNGQSTFKRNNEKDMVKDPPLSEAEKNVLFGK